MKIIFMGTPELGAVVLEKLITSRTYAPQLVIAQPDKPKSRGQTLVSPPVKLLAEKHGIEVWQPASLKDTVFVHRLHVWKPNLIIVAAYGKLIPKEILAIPSFCFLNIHPSLLPRHRGPSPVQFTILEGDSVAGTSIMLLDEGMDTGPILAQKIHPLSGHEYADMLSKELFAEGAELLLSILPQWTTANLKPNPQKKEDATLTRLLTKKDGEVKPEYTAERIERMVRAFMPWPGTYFTRDGKLIKILETRSVPCAHNLPPLTLSSTSKGELRLHTAKDCLILGTVQPEGKKPMSGRDFIAGYKQEYDIK